MLPALYAVSVSMKMISYRYAPVALIKTVVTLCATVAAKMEEATQGSSGFNGQLRYRSLSPISIDNFLSDIGPISDPMIGDNLS